MAILRGRGDWENMLGSAPIKRWRWELFAVFLRTSLKSRLCWRLGRLLTTSGMVIGMNFEYVLMIILRSWHIKVPNEPTSEPPNEPTSEPPNEPRRHM